ncbi:MAG: PDGLE domain-containing protein [Dehalococcoidales bacterium]|nr:PDGLE domain-containing protein [Dehalococcoidales bacterium]
MNNKKWWFFALLFCLLVATISPLASSSPDGLEKVAEDKGFLDIAQGSSFEIIADYVFPGIHNEALATILAGWTGVLIMFGVAYGISWLVQLRKKKAMV